MTDLSKGIIEIDGVEIGPETTLEQFEHNFVSVFTKEECSPTVAQFALNGYVRRLPNTNFDPTIHKTLEINGMKFLNMVVLFRNGHIEKIELISYLQSWDLSPLGKRIYSSEREQLCFSSIANWAKDWYGEPNNDPRLSTCWNYNWGCLRPMPISSHGSDTSVFLIEYGRNCVL